MGGVEIGMANTPGNCANARQSRSYAANQIGVIHPCLHDIRSHLLNKPKKLNQTGCCKPTTGIVQGVNSYAYLLQSLSVYPSIRQRDHMVNIAFAHIRVDQAKQNSLSTTITQACYDVNNIQRGH